MTGDHIPAVVPHEREMFGAEAWSAAAYREELSDTRSRHYVVDLTDDGTVTGWAGVLVLGHEAQVMTVGVLPAYRRQGIGRQLLADLVEHARASGARELFLEVRVDNEAARRLYLDDGFSEIGRRRGYYENGRVDGVTMRREL